MKTLLFIPATLLVLSASAEPLKSYDCKADREGSVTVDEITLQANKETLVFSFPGYSVTERPSTTFSRAESAQAPAELQKLSGARGNYFNVNKGENAIKGKRNQRYYAANWASVSVGLLRGNASGELTVYYSKDTQKEDYSWPREYHCKER